MNLVLKKLGSIRNSICSLSANGYGNVGRQEFAVKHSKRLLSKVINGNFSHKDGYIVRLEMSDDWNEYMAIALKYYCEMPFYATMFPDQDKRFVIMKQLLEHRYKSYQKHPENQAHFNFMLEHTSSPEKTKCIGGYNVTYNPEDDDGHFEWIKAIDEDGWKRYSSYWNWYQPNIFDTMEKLGEIFNLRAMYGRALIVQQEYRRHFDAIATGVAGLDTFSKQECDSGRKIPLIYLVAANNFAYKYERHFKIVKVFDYKNPSESDNPDQECVAVYENMGSHILQEIKNKLTQT